MDYYLDVACPMARMGPVDCPACAGMLNPNLVATCGGGGRCEVVDVENDGSLSSCETSEDCVVRVPDCCECGADVSAYRLIAIRATAVGDYGALVCDPDTGCPDCAPVYPPEVTAECVGGSCRIVIAGT